MDSCATHACWLLLTGRPAKLQPVYKAVLVETVFWKPSPASVRLPPVEAYGDRPVSKNIGDRYLKNRTCSNRLTDVGIGRGVNATIENSMF